MLHFSPGDKLHMFEHTGSRLFKRDSRTQAGMRKSILTAHHGQMHGTVGWHWQKEHPDPMGRSVDHARTGREVLV